MPWRVKEEERISRFKHQCYGCIRTIPKKEKVLVVTAADRGQIWSLYFCSQCVAHCKSRSQCRDCGLNECTDKGYIQDCINDIRERESIIDIIEGRSPT